MKFLPQTSLVIVSSLLLSGCAFSPSYEEKVGLIIYEKCLDAKTELITTNLNAGSQKSFGGWNPPPLAMYRDTTNRWFDEILEDCARFLDPSKFPISQSD